MTKTIALFGGSFNPPHEGHIAMASYIHNTLKVDETWLLFSESPQKDPAAYVSLKHRMNMADILIRNCDTPIILSDFEAKIDEQENQHQTYHVLNKIYSTYPEYKFIFTMGSDNFATLHSWHAWEKLMQSSCIAIVARSGYEQNVAACPAAKAFTKQKVDTSTPEKLKSLTCGWCLLNNPLVDISSTKILQQLKDDKSVFSQQFADVAAYIRQNKLYGTTNLRKELS